MMPAGFWAEYRSAFTRPHTATVRCEVWNDTEQVLELPIIGGNVDCSLASQVTRRGSLTCNPIYLPQVETDPLAPFGNELRIYRGINYSGRLFEFPVFTGKIQSAIQDRPNQPVTVSFMDRANDVAENDFEAVEETLPGRTPVEEIIRLIREGVPAAEFGDNDHVAVVVAAQQFDNSRAQACDELAEAGGLFWYALADGRYVIRRIPWTYHPDGVQADPVVEYSTRQNGPDQRPTLTGLTRGMSRENLYNIVVGTADQASGEQPRRTVYRDDRSDSPTYVNGKFGRRVLQAEFPATTATALQFATEALARRSRASAEARTWAMVPDCSLELGDLVALRIDSWYGSDRPLLRVVSDMQIPLTEEGEMTCSGRPLVLPDGTVLTEVSQL